MTAGFEWSDGKAFAEFNETESELLVQLCADVAQMLEEGLPDPDEDPLVAMVGITSHAVVPDDPALARLLPVGTVDAELAGEFRRYTDLSLRQAKAAALRLTQKSLTEAGKDGRVCLTLAEAKAWMTALTDVRLVLAERLQVRTEGDSERVEKMARDGDEDDPFAWLAMVYSFVSWVLETLMQVLLDNTTPPVRQ